MTFELKTLLEPSKASRRRSKKPLKFQAGGAVPGFTLPAGMSAISGGTTPGGYFGPGYTPLPPGVVAPPGTRPQDIWPTQYPGPPGTPGYNTSPYTGGGYSSAGTSNTGQRQREIEFQQAYPGNVPGSPYIVNYGLGARSGTGVDIMNRGVSDLQSFAAALREQAEGRGGPTAAESTFQSALDKNLAAAMALGQSTPGATPGAALRNILEQQGRATGASAADAATLRAQEQQRAQQMYSTVTGGLAQLGAGLSEEDRAAMLDLERMREAAFTGQQAQATARSGQQMGLFKDIAGGVIGAAGAVAAPFTAGSSAAAAAAANAALHHAKGGKIANEEMVPGKDSEAYDQVHALLSPGEIVLPRSVTQKGDAPERARQFVAHLQRHASGGAVSGSAGGEPNYGPVLAKLKRIKAELQSLGV